MRRIAIAVLLMAVLLCGCKRNIPSGRPDPGPAAAAGLSPDADRFVYTFPA